MRRALSLVLWDTLGVIGLVLLALVLLAVLDLSWGEGG
jgi:hypothetical protein